MKRIVLIKSWTNSLGKKYPVGQIIQGTKELCQDLIDSGKAKEYGGKYPPGQKMKGDLFNPNKSKNE